VGMTTPLEVPVLLCTTPEVDVGRTVVGRTVVGKMVVGSVEDD